MNASLTDLDDREMSPSEVALTWTNAQERLLVEWSDDALCYHWLHTRSEE
jgi:hypothetical protein